jgi:hypothetical protein
MCVHPWRKQVLFGLHATRQTFFRKIRITP